MADSDRLDFNALKPLKHYFANSLCCMCYNTLALPLQRWSLIISEKISFLVLIFVNLRPFHVWGFRSQTLILLEIEFWRLKLLCCIPVFLQLS